MKRAFVSTAIPYVNAEPHVGFALEIIQADVIARYQRLSGYDTFFLTGTDENSLKNYRAAQELGISTEELCERNSAEFYKLIAGLNISCDDFIRTSSDSRHAPAARKLWLSSRDGDLYKRHYTGLYCVGCEDFYAAGDAPEAKCPEHGTPLETVKEENYFFKLSSYQENIIQLIDSGKLRIVPESRRNEILAFARAGLNDFSASRTSERAGGWGIRVPDDPEQVIYVWYDALTNYISAPGYATDAPSYRDYWVNADLRIHVIGKGINRFHTLYWPAMLLSAGLALPDVVFIHGYLTIEGQKISKSLGNVVAPLEQAKKYGIDPFRYYLLRSVSPFEDGDYSETRLQSTYNSDLANNLGNLVSRVEAMGQRVQYTVGDVEPSPVPESFHSAMKDYKFNDALAILWSEFSELNRLFEVKKPWELLKEGRTDEVSQFLFGVIPSLLGVADCLEVFLPETANTIKRRFQPGVQISKNSPLFPRLK
ncbi:MAG: methionine--tRNA ligase [Candidatus Zixiibacteriota bacterium]|nr:MAG: methionine--tRNA ligase [candidate division Zixibacteria bacterium]